MTDPLPELASAAGTTLTTARLRMPPMVASDASALFPALQDERLYRYIPQDPPPTLAALEKRLAAWERRQSPDGREVWLNWVMRLSHTDALIGTLQATIRQDHTATIAYQLFPAFWGQGLAREGCAAMLNHLGQAWPVARLLAEIDTRNDRSIHLVEALGFLRVRTVADAAHFKGSTSHEHHYERRVRSDGD